jgi:molybdate-binding protein/DNA-binding transcriptional regulator YhcF (GntR family)
MLQLHPDKGYTLKNSQAFLYLQIFDAVRALIASGELKPGDKLPSVRDMAARWNCTPGTVSRAYASLAQDGLVEAHRGRGTLVTSRPPGSQVHPAVQWMNLVNRAERFLLEAVSSGYSTVQAESALAVAAARWRDVQDMDVPQPRSVPAGGDTVLRFAGSHDLTIELLGQMLADHVPAVQLTVEFVGSLGGLIALAERRADLAGTHLWDDRTDTYNVQFVRRVLPGRRVGLLTVAHRMLGFMVPSGNPFHVRGMADLAHPDLRFVNRQAGSGTRVWLDVQLKAHKVTGDIIRGYDREESTHLAVARAIADEEANCGLGIRSAADAYGLDFVPLAHERYDLAIPDEAWPSAAVQALVEIVRSPAFQLAVAALGGYDTAQTGQETWVG